MMGKTSFAQVGDEEQPPPPVNIVLMTIPGEGTRLLADAIKTLPNTKPYPESWFKKQVTKRGFNTKKVMDNPKNLKWVMNGASIDLIIRFKRNRKKTLLYVGLVGPEKAKVTKALKIKIQKSGLTEEGAQKIKDEIKSFLKVRYEEMAKKKETKKEVKKEPDPDEKKDKVIKPPAVVIPTNTQHWLWLHGSGRLIKRDLSVGGRNGAVLNYQSAYYPGYELKVEATPAPGTPLGVYIDFTHGFDSINVTDKDNKEQTLSLTQLRVEGGAGYYLDEQNFKIRLCLAGRWVSYNIEDNEALPATSQTAVLVSGRFIYPLMPIVRVYGGIELVPLAFWGEGKEQFGEDVSTYGMGTSLGLVIDATPDLGIQLNYGFEMYRSVFTGAGSADFEDASAFELIQGVQAGIVYRM